MELDNRHKISVYAAIAGFILATGYRLSLVASDQYYVPDAQYFFTSTLFNSFIAAALWYAITYGIYTFVKNTKKNKQFNQLNQIKETKMETRQKWAIGFGILGALAPIITNAQVGQTPHILDIIFGGAINYLIAYGIATLVIKFKRSKV